MSGHAFGYAPPAAAIVGLDPNRPGTLPSAIKATGGSYNINSGQPPMVSGPPSNLVCLHAGTSPPQSCEG